MSVMTEGEAFAVGGSLGFVLGCVVTAINIVLYARKAPPQPERVNLRRELSNTDAAQEPTPGST